MIVRRPLVGLGLVAIAATTTPALADTTKQACAAAYVDAQVARKEGRLLDARDKLRLCADVACPQALRRDCSPWLAEVHASVPTLVVRVVDAAGAEVPDADVTVDGKRYGGPLEIDPGERTILARASGMVDVERRVAIAAKEGRREIVVRLAPLPTAAPPAPAAEPPPRRVGVAPIVLGAIGVVGVGAFAVLGSVGNAKKSDLDASGCKPGCSSDDVGSIKTMYIAADVSLGVGAASLLGAGIALAVNLASSPSPAAKAALAPQPGGAAFAIRF